MIMSRKINDDEYALVSALISNTDPGSNLLLSLKDIKVKDMSDGKMGSLLFNPSDTDKRSFGKTLIEKEFTDSDGITVIVAINLDENGNLYELDIWKVDFSPLNNFPSI